MEKRELIQSEALRKSLEYHRCGLAISMGVGKTRIGIQHIQKNYNQFLNVLVVAPKVSIFKSWDDELEKLGLKDLKEHINYTTYISLNKRNPNDYDIIYLDECHNLLASHEDFLKSFKGKILGLTGTPPVNKNTEKYKMVQKFCPIVFEFTVDDATDTKILNDYQIIIHELELSKLKSYKKKNKNGGFWYSSEKSDYEYFSKLVAEAQTPKQKQFTSIMRMRALMDYNTKEEYLKGLVKNIKQKCIVFANTQEQADRISKHSYHSSNTQSDQNLKLFSDGRIDLLSCVMQLSEGVTIPDLQQGIIMHAFGNERKSAQRLGRMLRLSPEKLATCHILCYKGTVDEMWVKTALKSFDQSKIKIYNPLV